MATGGPQVSRLSYGVWRIKDDPEGADVQRIMTKVKTCLDHGITTFDHADIYGGYGCEEAFGKVLESERSLREQIEIITKCGIMLVDPARPDNRIKHYNYSRQHIVASVERSLSNLHTEYVDVLLLHRPSPLLDPDEVAEAFYQLRNQGKVRHFGVSNFTPAQVRALGSRLDFGLVTNQVEINPLQLAAFFDGTLDQCLELGIAPMAWSPTAGGRLFRDDGDDAVRRVRGKLDELGGKYDATADQLIYAWLLGHPSRIIPVLGTNRPERIASAARALEITLDIQDWFALWTAATGRDVP
ncbi:MAG: aldo/keto reductase [Myxococcota bacterium]